MISFIVAAKSGRANGARGSTRAAAKAYSKAANSDSDEINEVEGLSAGEFETILEDCHTASLYITLILQRQ